MASTARGTYLKLKRIACRVRKSRNCLQSIDLTVEEEREAEGEREREREKDIDRGRERSSGEKKRRKKAARARYTPARLYSRARDRGEYSGVAFPRKVR